MNYLSAIAVTAWSGLIGAIEVAIYLSIQIAANAADYLGTLDKSIFNVFIHDQIDITLTITEVGLTSSS